jgi:hypothetical protein
MAEEESKYQRDSRYKLEDFIDKTQKKIQGRILAAAEVRLSDEGLQQNKPLKSQINGAVNDFTRAIKHELERFYVVEFQSDAEDLIVVNGPKQR